MPPEHERVKRERTIHRRVKPQMTEEKLRGKLGERTMFEEEDACPHPNRLKYNREFMKEFDAEWEFIYRLRKETNQVKKQFEGV